MDGDRPLNSKELEPCSLCLRCPDILQHELQKGAGLKAKPGREDKPHLPPVKTECPPQWSKWHPPGSQLLRLRTSPLMWVAKETQRLLGSVGSLDPGLGKGDCSWENVSEDTGWPSPLGETQQGTASRRPWVCSTTTEPRVELGNELRLRAGITEHT